MMAFLAKLVIKPGARLAFEKAQIELRKLTYEHEPDTLMYEFLQSRDDENTYLVFAKFKNHEAFEYHQKTEFHDRLVPPIMEALSEEMELTFYDGVGD